MYYLGWASFMFLFWGLAELVGFEIFATNYIIIKVILEKDNKFILCELLPAALYALFGQNILIISNL